MVSKITVECDNGAHITVHASQTSRGEIVCAIANDKGDIKLAILDSPDFIELLLTGGAKCTNKP